MTWLEGLITFLQVAAILSGAAFAALALFTEYKKDGKVTKYGRFAVIGIVLSALFSLGTQWGQAALDSDRSRKADEKAQAQLADEARRFGQQMDGLNLLSSSLRTLNRQNLELRNRADRSLSELVAVQTRVGQSLLATRQIGEQERRNTATVLQTMWDDTNRIDASRLSLAVTYECGPVSSQEAFPRLLESATATIRVAPSRQARLRFPRNTFSSTPLLEPDNAVDFRSIDQRIAITRSRTVDGDSLTQISRFTDFQTEDIRELNTPESWRDVLIDVVVRAYQPGVVNAAASAIGEEVEHEEALLELYTMPTEVNPDFQVTVIPSCFLEMELTINGRIVATGEAKLAAVSEWQEDVSGLVVVKFPIVPAVQDAFPRFSLTY